jgi:CheY-like chemotaxis protein
VESQVEKGTTFHVYLPASKQDPVPEKEVEGKPARGKGKILLIDDDPMILKTAGEMLRRLGYVVLTAMDHEQGIEQYQEAQRDRKRFSAVVMDLTVPGSMGGQEAVQQILRIDPDACVIVSSGYSQDPVMSDFRKHGFRGVVVKPYNIEDLAEAVQCALGPGGSPSRNEQGS